MPLLQVCFNNSEYNPTRSCFWQWICWSFSKKKRFCHIFQAYNFCHTRESWFSTPCHNSSDTICYKNNNFGFPKGFPTFWAKKENYYSLSLFTCHYSPVTIHWYYSPLLFTPKFCLFKGGCPLYLRQVFLFLVQDFFLRERLPLRAFLCENLLAYTSYFLLTLPTFSTKLVTLKAL